MRRLLLVMTALLCSTLLVQSQDLKVGILFDQFASERWKIEEQLITQKFEELGVECQTEVAHSVEGVQIDQAKKLISRGVDALIIIARDASEAIEIVDLARSKNIKVIAYDRFIPNANIDLFLSYDNVEVGRMQARAAIAAVPTGNYILVNGPVSDFNSIQFRQGQMEVIEEYNTNNQIDVVKDIVLDAWHDIQATMALYDSKVKASKTDCVISATDAVSIGVIQFLESEADLQRIYLTGQDASHDAIDNIRKGYQNMTILKPLKPLAETAAMMTYQLIMEEEIEGVTDIEIDEMMVKGKLFTPILIDKSNVNTNKELIEQIKLADRLVE